LRHPSDRRANALPLAATGRASKHFGGVVGVHKVGEWPTDQFDGFASEQQAHSRRHIDAALGVEVDQEDRVRAMLDEGAKQRTVVARSVDGDEGV
jgi:hypothetical protein